MPVNLSAALGPPSTAPSEQILVIGLGGFLNSRSGILAGSCGQMDRLPDPVRPVEAELRIRDHLQELLASDLFAGSPKLRKFLEFTVERTLAGTGDSLKEYHLGVTVYGRPADYDPRVDPIVRVEARRLRAKLKQFYASSGDGPVRIEYPTGS